MIEKKGKITLFYMLDNCIIPEEQTRPATSKLLALLGNTMMNGNENF